jgi:capsular polysaccharide biosynthesis protein
LVSRRETGQRIRVNESWKRLQSNLIAKGFQEVFFEELSPLEQAAAVNRASVIVAAHGAGVTNMLFASSKTKFIEVGNLKTTGGRLAAFHQLAQVAGCRYTIALGDRADAEVYPNGSPELSAVHLSQAAVDRITDEAIA